jgi:hypothetical protein
MEKRIGHWILELVLSVVCAIACAPTPAPTAIPQSPIAVPPTGAPTAIAPSPTPASVPAFNFAKDTTWVYEGVVKWDDKGKAQQKTLTWKMHIIDKIERSDGIVGYVMQGHPIDLTFYDASKPPSDYLYIAKANRIYQITLIDTRPIERIKDVQDALADLLNDETIVYDFPLSANKKFGPSQFLGNSDGKYTWVITEAKPNPLNGIKGVTPTNATEYTLNFKTNPDWQDVYYVPSIGITRFIYHHNGTLSDVDVKLVELTKP